MITFSEITNSNGFLTKTIRLDGKGGIVKTPGAHLTKGIVKTVQMPFDEMGGYIRSLTNNQALVHGVCDYKIAHVVSERQFRDQPETVTRTKKFFGYPEEGAGLMMFDHDPIPGQTSYTPTELVEIISGAWPGFKQLPKMVTHSTSSCIYDMDGNEVTGKSSGFHLYVPINPAAKIPEVGATLFKRLGAKGYCYIVISKAGSMLKRTVFDAAVFSPERIDFVAGAVCIGCEQRLPEPLYIEPEVTV